MADRPILIVPSILSADFGRLQDEVDSVAPYADWIQIDVMDGHFVPNLSFGAPVVKCLRTEVPLDIHLMVENPEDRIEEFLELNVGSISFHAEVTDPEARRALIAAIRNAGVKAGIAINPETPFAEIEETITDVDILLVMSVHPGFGGQSFIPDVLTKVTAARQQHPHLMIQVDGGVDTKTAPLCIQAGANNLVAGSAIFRAPDRAAAIAALRGS